ncbi:MAG: 50S ribosomal protein L2 [Candidatus Firestonebacteria bacterium]|nr:50S ribosomal protein L2 [Candidatus Firestonebacteria bacterium]
MPLKTYRPTSPGRRQMTGYDFSEITKSKPEKSLLRKQNKSGGHNVNGHYTARRKSGGHKRRYRLVDFHRDKQGVNAKVAAIEYDPNRTARIALLQYADGEKRYIVAPEGLAVGTTVTSGPEADMVVGNTLPLNKITLGATIHNIQLKPKQPGRLVRSAGSAAQLLAKEGEYAHVRLPSGEMRLIHLDCLATIGQVGNREHENITLGKAGRHRWLGFKPRSRGMAKNPCDHPMGGGEGRSKSGHHPVSPWGVPAKGYKTRHPKKQSDRMIIRRRK